MPQTYPSYADGLNGISELSAYCYNNFATYLVKDADTGEDGTTTEFTDSNTEPIGSITRTGFGKGTINIQYDQTTDELPGAAKELRPGFILRMRNRYYVVGAPKAKVVKNDVVNVGISVTEVQNPIIPILLSARGQQLKATAASGTLACAAINTRTGTVTTYAVEDFNNPGVIPGGVSINATTGVLTLPAGAVDLRVIATDTLDGTARKGWGRYTAV